MYKCASPEQYHIYRRKERERKGATGAMAFDFSINKNNFVRAALFNSSSWCQRKEEDK